MSETETTTTVDAAALKHQIREGLTLPKLLEGGAVGAQMLGMFGVGIFVGVVFASEELIARLCSESATFVVAPCGETAMAVQATLGKPAAYVGMGFLTLGFVLSAVHGHIDGGEDA